METSTSPRERLLSAAIAILGQRGVADVTHRSVEEGAGMARGSTRYYFGSRDELLAAVLDYMADLDSAMMDEVGRELVGGGVGTYLDKEQQAEVMRHLTARFAGDPLRQLARFELFLYAARRRDLVERLAQWRETFVQLTQLQLELRGAANPEAGARMCIAAMDGLILHALTAPHKDYQQFGPSWMALIAEAAVDLS